MFVWSESRTQSPCTRDRDDTLRHRDTGNREDLWTDPDSCLTDFISFSEFAEFSESSTSFRKNSNMTDRSRSASVNLNFSCEHCEWYYIHTTYSEMKSVLLSHHVNTLHRGFDKLNEIIIMAMLAWEALLRENKRKSRTQMLTALGVEPRTSGIQVWHYFILSKLGICLRLRLRSLFNQA